MPKNNITALAWYLRSAEQGNELAVKRRDQLKTHMSPDEIDAADKLSKELMAKKPEPVESAPSTQVPPAEMKPENADTPSADQAPPAETPATTP